MRSFIMQKMALSKSSSIAIISVFAIRASTDHWMKNKSLNVSIRETRKKALRDQVWLLLLPSVGKTSCRYLIVSRMDCTVSCVNRDNSFRYIKKGRTFVVNQMFCFCLQEMPEDFFQKKLEKIQTFRFFSDLGLIFAIEN